MSGEGDLRLLADRLADAAASCEAVLQSAPDAIANVAAAYRVQHHVVDRRIAEGDRLVGLKLGFTSRAKMQQMDVDSVIFGQLTDAMRIPEGDDVQLSRFIHPRVEPEVAFRIAADADLDDSRLQWVDAVDAVAPALEIIDSRYRDFQFSLEDVIADNTSASAFAIGSWSPLARLSNRAVRMRIDGRTKAAGSTSAILGDPLRGMSWLKSAAAQHRLPLAPGDVILAGAATAAVPLVAGVVTVDVADLGSVTVRAVPTEKTLEQS